MFEGPDQEDREPRPMTPSAAIGWTLGVWFGTALLCTVLGKVRSVEEIDLVSATACQAVVYLLALFLILRVHAPEASIRRFVALRPTHPLFYPLGLLLGVTTFGLASSLFDVIATRFPTGEEGKMSDLVAQASEPKQALLCALVVIVGPALEEIIFRGALVASLKKTTKAGAIVAVTACCFALVHTLWQSFVPIAIVGAVMALLRVASGSLLPSLLLHFAFNGVQFALLLREQAKGDEPGLLLPLFVLGLVGTAVLLLLLRVVARTDSARAARAADDAS